MISLFWVILMLNVCICIFQLESLRGQYENQLDSLRSEIDRSRERRNSKEDDGSGGQGQASDLTQQYKQVHYFYANDLGPVYHLKILKILL